MKQTPTLSISVCQFKTAKTAWVGGCKPRLVTRVQMRKTKTKKVVKKGIKLNVTNPPRSFSEIITVIHALKKIPALLQVNTL